MNRKYRDIRSIRFGVALAWSWLLLSGLMLASCGGGSTTPQYSLSVSVSGLGAGKTLTVGSGGTSQVINANGSYVLAQNLGNSAAYGVTLASQPFQQTCSLGSNAQGTVAAASIVVAISCQTDTYAYAMSWRDTANGAQALVYAYKVAPDGSLTAIAPQPLAIDPQFGLTWAGFFSPDRRYMYLPAWNSTSKNKYLLTLNVSATGQVSFQASSPLDAAGLNPALASLAVQPLVNSGPSLVYVDAVMWDTGATQTVAQFPRFTVNADATVSLSYQSVALDLDLYGPRLIGGSPDGKSVYYKLSSASSSRNSGIIAQFRVGPDGALNLVKTIKFEMVDTLGNKEYVVDRLLFDPTGRRAYVHATGSPWLYIYWNTGPNASYYQSFDVDSNGSLQASVGDNTVLQIDFQSEGARAGPIFSADGSFAYIQSRVYSVAANGGLTASQGDLSAMHGCFESYWGYAGNLYTICQTADPSQPFLIGHFRPTSTGGLSRASTAPVPGDNAMGALLFTPAVP